jgi:hypothetical protein
VLPWAVAGVELLSQELFLGVHMKKLLLTLFVLSIVATQVFAGQSGKLGLGITAGDPFGPTLKYWLSEDSAVDLGVGFNHDGLIYADYLWHKWGLATQSETGRVGLYAGIGGQFENERHGDDEMSARLPLGVNFLFNRSPLELFAELIPVFQFTPEGDFDLDAVIGVRVYFAAGR